MENKKDKKDEQATPELFEEKIEKLNADVKEKNKAAKVNLENIKTIDLSVEEMQQQLQKVNEEIIEKQSVYIEQLEKKNAYKTPSLVAGINQVMREVKGIEKTSSVGVGNNAFNAVSDKDVKRLVGQAMERAGLAIVPTFVEPMASVERWEVSEKYGNAPAKLKRKMQTFTEVKTKYLLMHESGEKIELAGYGQGIDNQDKGAGKATTYALKYALLYTFLIPTGQIDDADKTQPPKTPKATQTLTDAQFKKAIAAIEVGTYTKDELETEFSLSKDQETELKKLK